MQLQLVSAHGMLAIMEVLESRTSRDVTLRLLHIVNTVCLPAYAALPVLTLLVAGHSRYRVLRKLLSHRVRFNNMHVASLLILLIVAAFLL